MEHMEFLQWMEMVISNHFPSKGLESSNWDGHFKEDVLGYYIAVLTLLNKQTNKERRKERKKQVDN